MRYVESILVYSSCPFQFLRVLNIAYAFDKEILITHQLMRVFLLLAFNRLTSYKLYSLLVLPVSSIVHS